MASLMDNIPVRIPYATMSKLNRIRAWARRNNATVVVSRYATDAYEGRVLIATPWNEGRIVTDRKIAEVKTIMES
jgi:hypothetical protein